MASNLFKNLHAIEAAIFFLESIHDRLRFFQTPTNRLLDSVSAAEGSPLQAQDYIQHCRNDMKQGQTFAQSWPQALAHSQSGLKKEERDILLLLSDTLGVTDLENQLTSIAYIKELLENVLNQKREYCEKHNRMYQNMGLLGGIALVILLI